MAPYLVTAVVLACALGALNLLLTLAVIRRLREHTDALAALRHVEGSDVIRAGRLPADFAVTTTDGRPLRRSDLTGGTLVAFFSTGCSACTDALPRFVAQAAAFPGGPDQVLAVVSGGGPEASGLADQVTAIARVVIEDIDGDLATAFEVRAFPSWCLLDPSGKVHRSGSGWTELATPVFA
ncbi:TlpA disulfide reductase family protein [Micromonospora sp. NPDC048947]|uniref:TlpA disulfide reductase family protein n=1 Tax=Micromonospora sp. NPDC048947 TaxID=3154826 RepID=UPI0034062A75